MPTTTAPDQPPLEIELPVDGRGHLVATAGLDAGGAMVQVCAVDGSGACDLLAIVAIDERILETMLAGVRACQQMESRP